MKLLWPADDSGMLTLEEVQQADHAAR